jgi:hypothetical protein
MRDDSFTLATAGPLSCGAGGAAPRWASPTIQSCAPCTVRPVRSGRRSILRQLGRKPVLRYVPTTGKLVLIHEGKTEELSTVEASNHRWPAIPFWYFPAAVQAQTQQGSSAATVYQRLDATDPVIRRNARDELAGRGNAALPQLENVLRAAGSSVRLRVGAISVLNVMPRFDPDSLSGSGYLSIVRAAMGTDPTLAAEAYRFFERYSIAGSAETPIPAAPRPVTIRVRANKASDGDFTFAFTVRQTPPDLLLQLEEIRVAQDGGGGNTRWLFAVLAENTKVFELPNREYTDKPAPRTYRLGPADRASGHVSPIGKILKLSVIGYKPKNVAKAS